MKRQRSRNRKPSGNQNNPNRAYESNGPDGAKVRGNAQTIYEKYQQLARDANSSGDRVLAENYLQHAEHYFRLIRQMQPQRPVSEFLQRDPFSTGFDFDEDLDGEPVETTEAEGDQPEAEGGEGDQPRYENRRDRDRNDRDRNRDRDRNDRDRDRDRGDRNRDRDDRNGDRNANAERAPNADRDNGDDRPRRESRRERYERRRQQRLTDQEDTAPSGHIASTEPLGAAPAAPEVAGFEVVTPRATPIAPIAETPAAEAQPEPRTRGRRRNVEAEAPAESLGDSHLPAFLRVPVPAAAPEAPAAEVAAEEGEAPKRRTRRKKSEEAEA
ncbi:DUF4167 domain-containing protein [Asticcacaulis sp. AND118]|uniref:DUF4167 domain-containing protein n=1 Tax=Asticcacaulis sp. AND118 TaxID=2840468 RepID=UPI001CFF8C74|nr:DUF4167 domain-containing protein [Asticcacaulis sp. AND118]UDF03912.1 DUF4167 domain-containing protein [Asticcacaulis sp. AND118]